VKNSQSKTIASQNKKHNCNCFTIKKQCNAGSQCSGAQGIYPWVALGWWAGWTGEVAGAGHGLIKENNI
jgi:hypothetical protein